MLYSGEKFVIQIAGKDFKELFSNTTTYSIRKICYYTNESEKFVINGENAKMITDTNNTYITIDGNYTSMLKEGYLTIIIEIGKNVWKFENIDYVNKKSWMKYKDYKHVKSLNEYEDQYFTLLYTDPQNNIFTGNKKSTAFTIDSLLFNSDQNYNFLSIFKNSFGHYEATIRGNDYTPMKKEDLCCKCDLDANVDGELANNKDYTIFFQYKTNHDDSEISFKLYDDLDGSVHYTKGKPLTNTNGEWKWEIMPAINFSKNDLKQPKCYLELFNNSLRSCDYVSIRMIKIEARVNYDTPIFTEFGETTAKCVFPLMLKSLQDLDISTPESFHTESDIKIDLVWNDPRLNKYASYNDVLDANLIITYSAAPPEGKKYQIRLKRFGENPALITVGHRN